MRVPNSRLDWALIRRMTGRVTPDDDAVIDTWVAMNSGRARTSDPAASGTVAPDMLAQAEHALDAPLRVRDDVWRDTQWRQLAAQLEIASGHTSDRAGARSFESLSSQVGTQWSVGREMRSAHRQPRRFGLRATAFVGLVAGMLILWWSGLIHELGVHGIAEPAHVAMRTIAAANGQRTSVVLGDGTRVLLNAGSQLSVARDIKQSRTVALIGEAMFTVTHHTTQPFVVRVGTARVTVLGTTFTVRRYPEDDRVRVVVADGRVALHVHRLGSDGEATLGARTLGEVMDSSQTLMVTPNADVAQYTEWARGRLVFHNAPLRLVVPELERRYGLTIRLADSVLAEQRLQLTITDAPARDVLDLIALTLESRYVKQGNTVTFFPSRVWKHNTHEFLVPKPEVTYGK